MEQKIFEIEDLKELEEFLQSQSEIEQLRERLFAEFLKYADYKNAGEWNKAVRLCESPGYYRLGKSRTCRSIERAIL